MFEKFVTSLRGVRFKLRCWFKFRGIRKAVSKAFFPDGRASVVAGPFAGMRFLNEPVWGPITPKWLGSYEAPLIPCLDRLMAMPPAIVIDVGCAEGYYAAGFAWRMKQTIVHAFDADIGSLRQTRKLARANRVEDRLIIGNWCSHDDITRLAEKRDTLVFCDIEGGEQFLLDPSLCPALHDCRILVEIHALNGSAEAMSSLLTTRFIATHRIERIEDTKRVLSDFPELGEKMSDSLFQQAAEEYRGLQQHWLFMEPLK